MTSDEASDIYVKIGKDSDPNNFDFDMSFQNVTTITLSSLDFQLGAEEGYSVAMYVAAYNETANDLLNSTVVATFTEMGALPGILSAAVGSLLLAALL